MTYVRTFAAIGLILNRIGETLWPSQLGQIELLFSLIVFTVNLIVLTVVLYVAGVAVVGKKRAKFGDGFVISLFGTFAGPILDPFVPQYGLGAIISLIVWLLLIRRFCETGWLEALAVGILAMIVMVASGSLLGFLVTIGLLLP